jgi:peroxiredoxin
LPQYNFMQQKPYLTWIGIFAALAGAGISFSGFSPALAAVCALAGYFLTAKDFSRFTGHLQSLILLFAAVATGAFLGGNHAFTIIMLSAAMLFTALATYGRMIFFTTFRYVNYAWLEPVLLVVALLFYTIGNINAVNIWSWIIPVPAFLFAGIITKGIFGDRKQLKPAQLKGYKVATGSDAPDFELPDENGNLVKLSSFFGQRHLLVVFVRGDWCPGCHMMLRAYQRESERLKQKNIHVLSVGPDPAGVNRDMVQRLGLSFHVLSDEGQRTAMRYGVQLQEYDNDFADKYEEGIPLPASFLIDKTGKVLYVSRPDKPGEFLNPELIFPIIDKLANT